MSYTTKRGRHKCILMAESDQCWKHEQDKKERAPTSLMLISFSQFARIPGRWPAPTTATIVDATPASCRIVHTIYRSRSSIRCFANVGNVWLSSLMYSVTASVSCTPKTIHLQWEQQNVPFSKCSNSYLPIRISWDMFSWPLLWGLKWFLQELLSWCRKAHCTARWYTISVHCRCLVNKSLRSLSALASEQHLCIQYNVTGTYQKPPDEEHCMYTHCQLTEQLVHFLCAWQAYASN